MSSAWEGDRLGGAANRVTINRWAKSRQAVPPLAVDRGRADRLGHGLINPKMPEVMASFFVNSMSLYSRSQTVDGA